MYALLCDVQQSSVTDEAQLKSSKAEVQHLKDKLHTLQGSIKEIAEELGENEGRLERIRRERKAAATTLDALIDACASLRCQLLDGGAAEDDKIMLEVVAAWRHVSAEVSKTLQLQSERQILPPDHPSRDVPLCALSDAQNNEAAPKLGKFAIQRGVTTKKTMFQFR